MNRRNQQGIGDFIRNLLEMMHRRRTVLISLSCVVVFLTTYLLILPAFTLDKEEATEQGGISVPTVTEETTEADIESDDEANAEPAGEAQKADTQEKKENTKKSESVTNESAKSDSAKTESVSSSADNLLYEGDNVKISIDDSKSVLPADASIKVEEIDKEKKEYAKHYKKLYKDALTAVQDEKDGKEVADFSFAKFYDISILDGKNTVEPDSAVDVKIEFDKELRKELAAKDTDRVRIIHFTEDKNTGEITPEVLKKKDVEVNTDSKDKLKDTTFKADGFSVYAVVYTEVLQTNVISDSGDTYEVTVSYDESAGIPDGAELDVREIKDTEKEYKNNINAANEKLKELNAQEVTDPAQFDISIVADGEEVEPKEGSTVNVEIKLTSETINKTTDGNKKESEEETGEGEIWFNGDKLSAGGDSDVVNYTVAHISDNGKAEILEDVDSYVDDDDNVVLKFETESFSDYLFDGNSEHGFNNLPNTIYVGDEIYMWNQADYWVTNIGSVVSETKHNNSWRPYPNASPDSSNYKTVTALQPGKFRIVHRNDWNNGNPYRNYKEITVLPARTGTTPPDTIDTVDNARIGLTLNLFDYDLDNYLDDYYNGSSHYDATCIADFAEHGINSGHNLKFWGSGIGANYGSQNQYVEHGVTRIVKNTLDTGAAGGYPVLSTDNTSLDYLFKPSDGTDKKAYTNVNHLFKKDGDYYVYDSNENYAYYDPEQGSNGNFEVYNRTYKQKTGGEGGSVHTSEIGFFPFHKWDEEYDRYVNWNKNLNHHFGMSMSVPFSLPKDPKAVTDSEGNDIVFEFSGDDDLWVFIDGKLAMDIGGIHRPTSGAINFTQKKVVVNGSTQTGYSFPDNLYDGNSHTLQVFYIERGGCDSNCMIRFNLTRYGDVHFDKVDKDDPSDKLRGALFGLYKDEACTQPLTENLKSGGIRAFVAESNASGRVQFQDVPLGTYYLKELRAPDGYPLDPTVHTVDVFLTENNDVQVKVTIDNEDVSSPGVQIPNKKPDPINVGLKKEWKDDAGNIITAPSDSTATFEIKRMRTYETYTEISTGYNGREAAHLTVGWIHDGQKHVYEEFDLVAESHVEVSWGYTDGYTGSKDCIVDDERIDKDYVDGNVVSYGFDMPGPNGNASLYIIDESDSGEAIRSINVAGRQFYGNSGGGVIHEFKTFTEPDSEFTYTGENVEDNKVELPINSNTWQYDFTNLPVVGRGAATVDGKQQNVTFKYSYYLEEKSSNSPAGTTVTYKDHTGKVISKPTDAEMHQSGYITVTNSVPTGYLQIDKEVTFNGEAPSTAEQKSALAGTYTFKVFTDENCSKPYKVITGEAPNQQEQDLTLEIIIAADGTAKSSDKVKLPVGDYWIEEQNPTQEGVTPEANRLKVTVTKDNTTSEPAITSFTNNKEESDNPDELAIELEKTFTGLSSAAKIPANYQATLTYKLGAQTETVPLTGTTQGNVTCTKSSDGMTWHWRVTRIPKTATDFAVSESNYDIDGYTRVTKINGNVVDNPGESHKVAVLVPEITMTNISRDYTTSDKKKVFEVKDNQILLVRLTSHATVIVSPKSLSKATRTAIENMITENNGKIPGDDGAQAKWELNFVYFSHEIQGDSFSYGGRTIYFDGDKVKIPHNASSHEVRVDINYKSESAENSFTIENDYTETPTEVDVLKVEKGKETTTQLTGAVFELRKLNDVAPSVPGGTLDYVKDKNQQVIVTSKTTGKDGRLTFDGLIYGVYEIREVSAPPGYIKEDDVIFYLRVDGGVITYVQKGNGKPSTWEDAPNNPEATVYYIAANNAEGTGDDATNATFRVSNEPGAELPKTGGIGTTIFYIFGAILVIGSGIFLVSRRRVSE